LSKAVEYPKKRCSRRHSGKIMRKKEDLIHRLKPIIDDPDKLEKFLMENSNLPGPRGNLELAFALAEVYENIDVLIKWTEIDAGQAGGNDPRSFLPFCSAVCLGKIYTATKDNKIVRILRKFASDDRWRIREASAFGFQLIGEDDFPEIERIFSEWIEKSSNREKRAILVSLAHPKILDEKTSLFCFEILENVFKNIEKDNDFEILRKGLDFTISVYAAANPEFGFSFMEKWIGKENVIDKIIKSNLKKNRLLKKYPKKTEELIKKIMST
jgi:hypothetical protein